MVIIHNVGRHNYYLQHFSRICYGSATDGVSLKHEDLCCELPLNFKTASLKFYFIYQEVFSGLNTTSTHSSTPFNSSAEYLQVDLIRFHSNPLKLSPEHKSTFLGGNAVMLFIWVSLKSRWVIINLPIILGTFLSKLLTRPNKNILAQLLTIQITLACLTYLL